MASGQGKQYVITLESTPSSGSSYGGTTQSQQQQQYRPPSPSPYPLPYSSGVQQQQQPQQVAPGQASAHYPAFPSHAPPTSASYPAPPAAGAPPPYATASHYPSASPSPAGAPPRSHAPPHGQPASPYIQRPASSPYAQPHAPRPSPSPQLYPLLAPATHMSLSAVPPRPPAPASAPSSPSGAWGAAVAPGATASPAARPRPLRSGASESAMAAVQLTAEEQRQYDATRTRLQQQQRRGQQRPVSMHAGARPSAARPTTSEEYMKQLAQRHSTARSFVVSSTLVQEEENITEGWLGIAQCSFRVPESTHPDWTRVYAIVDRTREHKPLLLLFRSCPEAGSGTRPILQIKLKEARAFKEAPSTVNVPTPLPSPGYLVVLRDYEWKYSVYVVSSAEHQSKWVNALYPEGAAEKPPVKSFYQKFFQTSVQDTGNAWAPWKQEAQQRMALLREEQRKRREEEEAREKREMEERVQEEMRRREAENLEKLRLQAEDERMYEELRKREERRQEEAKRLRELNRLEEEQARVAREKEELEALRQALQQQAGQEQEVNNAQREMEERLQRELAEKEKLKAMFEFRQAEEQKKLLEEREKARLESEQKMKEELKRKDRETVEREEKLRAQLEEEREKIRLQEESRIREQVEASLRREYEERMRRQEEEARAERARWKEEFKQEERTKVVSWLESNPAWRDFFKSSGVNEEELRNPMVLKALIERTGKFVKQRNPLDAPPRPTRHDLPDAAQFFPPPPSAPAPPPPSNPAPPPPTTGEAPPIVVSAVNAPAAPSGEPSHSSLAPPAPPALPPPPAASPSGPPNGSERKTKPDSAPPSLNADLSAQIVNFKWSAAPRKESVVNPEVLPNDDRDTLRGLLASQMASFRSKLREDQLDDVEDSDDEEWE